MRPVLQIMSRLWDVEDELVAALLPLEEGEDAKEAVLEVRAGTGGSEAQLFAMEVFEMYQKWAALNRWKFDVSFVTEGDLSGTCREASAMVKGQGVYAALRFEGGVHR